MPNIKLSYLYRDAGNYKNFGHVVLANPENIELGEVEQHLKKQLIDGCWFYAEAWQLPDLHFANTTPSDPTWHEFENIEHTDLHPNAPLTLNEFTVAITNCDESVSR